MIFILHLKTRSIETGAALRQPLRIFDFQKSSFRPVSVNSVLALSSYDNNGCSTCGSNNQSDHYEYEVVACLRIAVTLIVVGSVLAAVINLISLVGKDDLVAVGCESQSLFCSVCSVALEVTVEAMV